MFVLVCQNVETFNQSCETKMSEKFCDKGVLFD